ncbi:dolichyl-phosphate-mannose--protein mannosyltransferase [Demetria terragena]|uniref:dolichyl-phosphate-mannose--protein mannosyltransferase n=1 Tax=Demetria terragena TaxID=63959 RepID=UPI000373ADF3|nr:phospholipid carrier-dependent glycosyltransferase [Demetria terragena]
MTTTAERPAPADAPLPPEAPSTRIALLRRLLGRPRTARERLWAWLGPAIVTIVGGVLRLWDLGRPHQLIFDETYYVKQGWSTVLNGYEVKRPESVPEKSVDGLFTNDGAATVYGTEPDLVVHPPVGKWVIGWGEQLFGIDDSFGWRFGVAIAGTLLIYLVGRAAWHLFRSAFLATIASVLIAVEGMAFVHSRVSILDGILTFWVVAGFVALLADRDAARRRLATLVAAQRDAGEFTGKARLGGPWLGIRPWRFVAGVCLGLACGTKWSGGFFLAAFGLLSVFWDLGARRAVGVTRYVSATFIKDAIPGAVIIVGSAAATYLASWWGWLRSSGGYGRDWADKHPAVKDTGIAPDSSLFGWVPDSLRSLWNYHLEMFDSASSITSPHAYESNPWSWMIQARPVLYFAEYPKEGEPGCTSTECAKIITSLGNVSIWWVATAALAVLLFMWALRRDWRAGAILAGLLAGWLPWFMYQERTIFTFYAVVMAPFAVLAVTYVCGLVLGSPAASAARLRVGRTVVVSYVVLAVAFFVFWWPIYTAQIVPRGFWQLHNWFPSWI